MFKIESKDRGKNNEQMKVLGACVGGAPIDRDRCLRRERDLCRGIGIPTWARGEEKYAVRIMYEN